MIFIKVGLAGTDHGAAMMYRNPRFLICLLLCLSLTVVGFARGVAGVAMAQAATLTQIVICGESGPEMITLDKTGAALPADAKGGDACGKCPDCVLGQSLVSDSQPGFSYVASYVRTASPQFLPEPVTLRLTQGHPARAPPQKA